MDEGAIDQKVSALAGALGGGGARSCGAWCGMLQGKRRRRVVGDSRAVGALSGAPHPLAHSPYPTPFGPISHPQMEDVVSTGNEMPQSEAQSGPVLQPAVIE